MGRDQERNELGQAQGQFRICGQFFWDQAIIEPDLRKDYGEERFIARGRASDGLGYHVVFTMREGRLRLITMRRFSRKDYIRYGR